MRICVCVKQTPDSSSVYVDPISGEIDGARFVQILNPADACAIEAAVRLKELHGGHITALTFGPHDAEGALRAALALGATTVARLWNPQAAEWGAFTVAAALAAYIQREMPSFDLILCGDTSSDWASGIVGPALAQYLDLPQITGVVQLHSTNAHELVTLHLTRKLERGYRELIEAELPLLITVTGDLNEPRYPSLPSHLAALTATIPVFDPLTLMDRHARQDEANETTLIEVHTPRPRPRHLVAPNSKHSPYQRIGEIVSGGTATRQVRLVEGSPQELATELVKFLQHKGFI